jgi:hypothetical protein
MLLSIAAESTNVNSLTIYFLVYSLTTQHLFPLTGSFLQTLGNNYAYHGLIYSTYSKENASMYLLLTWLALVVMIVLLGLTMGYLLKKKDVRT